MTTSLFQFELNPVAEIQPWMGPEGPQLHWFGLTHGLYWMQVGDHRLFEYSPDVVSRFGWPRFCEYQVARLHEDVLYLARYALEPVPQELHQYVAGDWDRYWRKWSLAIGEGDPSTASVDEEEALWWMRARTLDSAYLTPSTQIMLWSTHENVHIQWDNRLQRFQECQAWSADHGVWKISRSTFVNEVRSFHARLITQMAERLSEIANGALGSHVHVDMEGLLRQHDLERRSIDRSLAQPDQPTDWPSVIEAIQSLEVSRA